MKKIKKKLGLKLNLLILLFLLVLGVAISSFSYYMSWHSYTAFYSEKLHSALKIAASFVDGDSITAYLDTMETDEAYDELRTVLNEIKKDFNISFLYIYQPSDTYLTYIIEAQLESDDPNMISQLGERYDYTEFEYKHIVPDVRAERASEGVILVSAAFMGLDMGVEAWEPIFNSDGDLVAMVSADLPLTAVIQDMNQYVVLVILIIILIIAIVVVVMALLVGRMVTKPLTRLTGEVREFASGGNLSPVACDIFTGDEIQELSEAFSKMSADIDAYTKTQASVAADRERLSAEMNLATNIQRTLIPEALPVFAGRGSFEIKGLIDPALETSGNFYDYFALDEVHVCTVIGEVMGRGLPAALFMVIARTVINSQMQSGHDLTRSMTAINRQLFNTAGEGLALSAIVGVLDTGSGRFTYINAGHSAPFFLKAGGRCESLPSQAYAPLAMNENVVYRSESVDLEQGDRLYFYTSGVTGRKDRGGAPFGDERLRTALNAARTKGMSLESLLGNIRSAVEVYADAAPRAEDITMLALEYTRGRREFSNLTVAPDMARLPEIRDAVKAQLGENGISGRLTAMLMVAVEELFSMCCRRTEADINVQCAVSTEAEPRIALRMAADTGGWDPLEEQDDAAVVNAVAFIRKNFEGIKASRTEGRTVILLAAKSQKT